MNGARLLIPAIRADARGEFEHAWSAIQQSIDRGVGGFILFGGEAASVRVLTGRIRAATSRPLLIGSDLERGAGQQFRGATSLPPAAAIASLEDLEVTRRAGNLTAIEAAALGINWIFAPVADLDVEPRNPIVSTRAFGSEPDIVAEQVTAWISGCHGGGALACAKHFPGHGRTTGDSHLERAVVDADRATLDLDLIPFRAAVYAGVDSMMTAHVAYPALDSTGEVATLSPAMLRDLLRDGLAFEGLIVSDALGMAGLSHGMGEGVAAVRAIAAGCDLLLYPEREEEVLDALERATSDGSFGASRLGESTARLDAALARIDGGRTEEYGSEESQRWSDGIALRSVRVLRGDPRPPPAVSAVQVDDDVGGPHPAPPRDTFLATLEEDRVEVAPSAPPLVAIYADPRASKGRAGLSSSALAELRDIAGSSPDVRVVLFGHPRLAEQIPFVRHVLCAWGGEPVMQKAAARWLSAGVTGGASREA